MCASAHKPAATRCYGLERTIVPSAITTSDIHRAGSGIAETLYRATPKAENGDMYANVRTIRKLASTLALGVIAVERRCLIAS